MEIGIEEAQQRSEQFLTDQMLRGLDTVDYALPRFDTERSPTRHDRASRCAMWCI
jgi:hypothetical protein